MEEYNDIVRVLKYDGIIKKRLCQYDEALFIGNAGESLTKIIKDKINDKKVVVYYWIADEKIDIEKIDDKFLRLLIGEVNVNSNIAEEALSIGEYDLLKELERHVGKYVYLIFMIEVDYNLLNDEDMKKYIRTIL